MTLRLYEKKLIQPHTAVYSRKPPFKAAFQPTRTIFVTNNGIVQKKVGGFSLSRWWGRHSEKRCCVFVESRPPWCPQKRFLDPGVRLLFGCIVIVLAARIKSGFNISFAALHAFQRAG
jgi:hypothetical protein